MMLSRSAIKTTQMIDLLPQYIIDYVDSHRVAREDDYVETIEQDSCKKYHFFRIFGISLFVFDSLSLSLRIK